MRLGRLNRADGAANEMTQEIPGFFISGVPFKKF